MPRQPKPPELRQRRNKASTRAKLKRGREVRAPALPIRGCVCGGPAEAPQPARGKRKRGRPRKMPEPCRFCHGTGILPWHHLTKAWWGRVWASPMAPEYIESDIDALYVLASLRDEFWRTGGTDGKLAAEVRLQEARFGATPLDRRRLEWEMERERDEREEPQQLAIPMIDPRATMRLVR
jgi:hypothetical protein